ncbi:MAG TPA: hypothetical protein VKY62_05950, partial [Devosia sp.]|nr:hypothetical protein [Devosia sp.]
RFPGWADCENSATPYANCDPFFATIISERLATWTELREKLTLAEAMQLWEVAVTNRYNEWLAMRRAKEAR